MVRLSDGHSKKLEGVIAMMTTPLNRDESIDEGALRVEVDWVAEQRSSGGVKCSGGVMIPSIGHALEMDDDVRIRCFQVCMEQAKRYPHLFMIAMVGAMKLANVLKLIRVAKGLGYDGVQLNPCPYFTLSDASAYELYLRAAEEEMPIVVYNNHALCKLDIKPPLYDRLVQIPQVIGVKETHTDRHVKLEPLFRTLRGRTKLFTVYRIFTTGLWLGSNGGFINVFGVPAALKMWEIFHKPGVSKDELQRMEDIQTKLNEVFPRGHEGSPDIISVTKDMATVVTGIEMGRAYGPYLPPAEGYREELRKKLPELTDLLRD